MRTVKLSMSLLVLLGAQILGFSAWADKTTNPKCNCKTSKGLNGVKKKDGCKVVNCWVPLPPPK